MVKCDQTDMVFTAYITLRNGNRLYAKQVGKGCFSLHSHHLNNIHSCIFSTIYFSKSCRV